MKQVVRFAVFGLVFPALIACLIACGQASAKTIETTHDGSALKSVAVEDTLPRSCWLMQTGAIDAICANNGTIGSNYANCFQDCPIEHCFCPSFVTPPGSDCEYLFGGAVWFGCIRGDDTLVSVARDGWLGYTGDFSPPVPAATFDYVSDYSLWTLCSDTFPVLDHFDVDPHRAIGLRTVIRAHYWTGDPSNNIIVYDLTLTNVSDDFLQQGYVGVMFDGDAYHTSDVAGFQDDLAGSLPDENIAYIIDNDGDPTGAAFDEKSVTRAFACKFLAGSFSPTDTSFNWWISNGVANLDFGPRRVDEFGNPQCLFYDPWQEVYDTIRSGTPICDRDKYCFLSNGEWDYDQVRIFDSLPGWEPVNIGPAPDYMYGADVKFLLSLGPVDLLPDSSVRVLFATFTGGDVHTDPDNLQNLSDDPGLYLAGLSFDSIIAVGQWAQLLADSLLNPNLPPTGLYVRHNDRDSVVLEWDPWTFNTVVRNSVFLYEIPGDSLPYPGLVPPWLDLGPEQFTEIALLDPTWRFSLTGLNYHHVYAASLTQHPVGGSAMSDFCPPVAFMVGGDIPAPVPASNFAMYTPGDPVTISWTGPDDITVDHYNVYKFAGLEAAANAYAPFYDLGESELIPKDSFFVDGSRYFYYAMTPHAQVGPGDMYFSETAAESTVYIITAVDETGCESLFSTPVIALQTVSQTRDIVVVTGYFRGELIDTDSIIAFYESVLDGYDYAVYNVADTQRFNNEAYLYSLWMDLAAFRLVIIEDGIRAPIIVENPFQTPTYDVEKTILSGSAVACFGSFWGLRENVSHEYDGPGYYALDYPFCNRYFAVDSVFWIDPIYYFNQLPLIAPDSIIGFIRAESAGDPIPDLAYDTLRNPFLFYFWDSTVAPAPATFVLDDRAEILHVLRSRYPEQSWVEGDPVGARIADDGWITYLFGFRLFYMQPDDARALVNYMMGNIPTGADDASPSALPKRLALHQNYPNPFNPITDIRFDLPQKTHVRLDVFNILGRRVRTPLDASLESGSHAVEWDGCNDRGDQVASGIYFYRLRADESTQTRKMILLK